MLIGTSAAILNWDMQTYMPPKGTQQRGEQMATLGRIIHRMSTSEEVGKLINEADRIIKPDDILRMRNIYLLRKQYDEATKLHEDLVAAISKQRTVTSNIWRKSKPAGDWKSFQPELQKMVDLSVERAEALLEVKNTTTIYDALIDDFEPRMTSAEISKAFNELRPPLVKLTKKLTNATENIDEGITKRNIPIEIQRVLASKVANLIGYDTESDKSGGRIDEVPHPFTIGYYDDVRITIRYSESNPVSAILTILHEAGHALYEQNLNQEWKYQPVGFAASFGIHESISRFYENIIGRSIEFWDYYLPILNDIANNVFTDVDTATIVRAINLVRPSKIRVSADEVTYSLHIIIRFEIERDLFSGKIDVSELPQVWNQKYEDYLGVTFNNDGEGVMQDSHWSDGFFGYFPSYALGNIYGGMWLKELDKDLPEWRDGVINGAIEPATNWLVEKIMSKSNLYNPSDLMYQITGGKLTAEPFISYLENKYSSLFN